MHPDHPDLMYPLSGLLIQIHIQMYPQSLVVFNDFVVIVFVAVVSVVVVFVAVVSVVVFFIVVVFIVVVFVVVVLGP